MPRSLRVGLIVLLLLATGPFAGRAGAQAPQADMAALRDQMASVNRSLEQLVALFTEFRNEQARMSRGALLLRRLEVAQRAVEGVNADLRAARTDLQTQQDLIARLQGQVESLRQMSQQDRSGRATAAFESERATAAAAIDKAQQAAYAAQGRVSLLEQDVAVRQGAIVQLEAALDRELGNQ